MINTFDNQLTTSFWLWIQNYIGKKQGYQYYSGQLFKNDDPYYPDKAVYLSPFKFWEFDSSISGISVVSGVYQNNNFIPRGTSGLVIDYNNGRVFFDSGVNIPSGELTVATHYKEFGLYYTSTEEEKLVFETKYQSKPKNFQEITGINYNEVTIPAIFIKYNHGKNNPFELGGLDTTDSEFRCIILSDNQFLLDASCSILRDASRRHFPVLDASTYPFNYSGDLNSGYYNYQDTAANNFNPQNDIYIKDVAISKFTDKINTDLNPKVYGAFADFMVQSVRQTRVD